MGAGGIVDNDWYTVSAHMPLCGICGGQLLRLAPLLSRARGKALVVLSHMSMWTGHATAPCFKRMTGKTLGHTFGRPMNVTNPAQP